MRFPSLRYLIYGGDVVDPAAVASILASDPPAHLVNGYGPTENTTFTACYEADEDFSTPTVRFPSAGPISNTKVYVLDRALASGSGGRGGRAVRRRGWFSLGLSRPSGFDGGTVRARSV